MKAEYSITVDSVIINFSKNYCKTESELLSSECFYKIWGAYLVRLGKTDKEDLIRLIKKASNPNDRFVDLFKLLLSFEVNEIKMINKEYQAILSNLESVYELVEHFYDYWRRLQRYAVIASKFTYDGIDNVNFLDAANDFTNLVLKVYRNISQKLFGSNFHIYRQLPSGINVALSLDKMNWMKDETYALFKNISFIDSIVIRPPFIVYSKKNTRTGIYPEVFENPLAGVKLNTENWFCYPAKVGSALAYIYFHKDYLAHGITLCNLFDFVHRSECEGKNPDLIYVFGACVQGESRFYHDQQNDIYIGVAPYGEEIDYFGYMKKMLLTLYNVKMINNGYLPIHGACVNISLKSGEHKTLVIIGDSGAGKSESLEALRSYAGEQIVSMQIIFDDMGTFKIVEGEVYAYGTEIGAFVRLDDLENGYAYKEMDRAIFMNPDKTNSRIVMPVATHSQIMKGHKVDMCLYANNYEGDKGNITYFSNAKDAIEVFKQGARVAKGTTSENGLVTSYFANPFGPVQRQEQCDVLLEKYFDKLFESNVVVGEIYTRLAISGNEHSGPAEVAKTLFELLEK